MVINLCHYKFKRQLFTGCSLLVEIHPLLVGCWKVIRYLLQKLLVAKHYLLIVAKFAGYSLTSCLLQKITRYLQQILLVTRCIVT